MNKSSVLTTTPITDGDVLQKCKNALNKWSRELPFAITRKLGDDGELISATMYHAYTFSISNEFAHRKFLLEKGGKPVSSPLPIDQVDMWDIDGAKLEGDYKVGLPFTCYKETCEQCHGNGRVTCPECHGQCQIECGRCNGSGHEKCPECGGKGEVHCPSCGGSSLGALIGNVSIGSDSASVGIGKEYSHSKKYCPKCCGSGKVICHKCRGTGERTCKKCSGRGMVTCPECKGRGEVQCSICDGKGYIPWMYHLVQKQMADSFDMVWGDTGIPKLMALKEYKNYPADDLFSQRVEDNTQLSVDLLPDYEAPFIDELCQKWREFYEKYDGASDVYLHFEEVSVRRLDAVIRYEYKYKGKEYLIWIDLTSNKVFESEERGLMTEWGKKVSEEGDKAAKKLNPQMAIFHYATASAITTNNQDHARKLRMQLSLGSWLFRLAAGGFGGWLWTLYLGTQGADPMTGWYLMGALILIDILFAQKWFWMQFVAAGTVYGLIRYLHLIPGLISPQIAGDVYAQAYIMSSLLAFVGGSLLFARDLALRIRGGILVFPVLGVLVGGATAPGMYLDFAPDPELMIRILNYVAYGLCGLAIIRTWNRYWVQNCGWIAQKVPGGVARFQTNMLHPRFWPIPFYMALFTVAGYGWYRYAGPGVSIETKVQVAERFLKDEPSREKGKRYLSEAVKADYLPAVSRLAEFQITGQYGYAEDPMKGYELAVRAGERNDAKAWRLQGYCLEYGKGIAQNLTEANARYAKAVELGDEESIALKQKTAEIAKVWNPAQTGDKEAQYGLALCYASGNGITKDEGIARIWLLKAADAGHIQAQMLACDWLIKGVGGAKNPELGVKYCEKAALQGNSEAIAELGYYYFDGKIIPQDYPKAIESFERACEKGSDSAPCMLGYCYREGLGVETNTVKAYEYFALANKRGSLPGAYANGECLEYGKGVEINYTDALSCYRRAAEAEWESPLLGKTATDAKAAVEKIAEIGAYWNAANVEGDGMSMDKVGLCYANGTGVEKNPETAYGWYVKSSEKECVDGIVHMADALYDGVGVDEDKNAAGKAYERAARLGNVHAIFRLGVSHENGWGVEKNLTTAFTLYTAASTNAYEGAAEAARKIEVPARYWDLAFNGKDADAQYNLAMCYRAGNCGLTQNMEEAFKLFRMSADQGNPAALYEAARCYATGIGIEKNDTEMNKAVMVSAKKGYPAALYFVGELYQSGRSVEFNPTTAHAYYEKAVEVGFPKADERAKTIDKIARYWDAAHRGDVDSQYRLGLCYRDGIQIKRDETMARQWFEKAVAQGQHEAEYALAALRVREDGDEGAKAHEIVVLLEKAAGAGHVQAKSMLGRYLYTGKGTEENYERAVKLWQEASEAGDLEAKYNLGEYYYTGRGLFSSGKDQEKALRVWIEASEAGNRNSSLRLAKLYAEGTGLFGSDKNPAKAREYSERAEAQIIKIEPVDPLGGFDAFESLKNVQPEVVQRKAEEQKHEVQHRGNESMTGETISDGM